MVIFVLFQFQYCSGIHHVWWWWWWWCNALGFEIELRSFIKPSKFFISACNSSVLNEGWNRKFNSEWNFRKLKLHFCIYCRLQRLSFYNNNIVTHTGIGWLKQSHGPLLLWSTSGDLTSAMTGSLPDWKADSLFTWSGWMEVSFSVPLLEWLVSQLEEPLLPESLLPSVPPLDKAQLSFFRWTGKGFLKGLEGWGRTAEK